LIGVVTLVLEISTRNASFVDQRVAGLGGELVRKYDVLAVVIEGSARHCQA
jgi:hypothetical protein